MHRIYSLCALVVVAQVWAGSDTPAPLQESTGSSVGYPTVAAALAALRAKPGAHIEIQGGWTIVTDKEAEGPVLWSFTPAGHPAHPSAVKRTVTASGSGSNIEMNVLCESGKVACDALVRQFEALNEHIGAAKRQNAEHRIAPGEASADSKNMAEIKVTTDSAAGWLPSAEQQAEISRAVKMFLAALDAGEYATAYALMTPGQQALETAEAFEHRVSKFNTEAGSVQERRMVKVTWTKDPANAPAPGVYAAVDLASRFENIDRHCGYVVLYQRDAVAPWRVTRQEDSYMTNEQARQIEQRQSRQAVNDLWGKMSQHCPNYAGATAAETK